MVETGSRDVGLVRAPALPAQSIPGGRVRKGGEAPRRACKKAVVTLQPGHKIELVEGA